MHRLIWSVGSKGVLREMDGRMSGDTCQEIVQKIDKSQIPVCRIMKVDVAAINMEWLIRFTRENIKDLGGNYCCVANVHTTVTAWEDGKYREIQNESALTIPDGGPLSSIGRKRGHVNMGRTAGPDYMEEVFKMSAEEGYRHFFYGSTQETLDKLKEKIEKKYPGIEIVGMYSPPFQPLSEEEDKRIINRINKSDADFIWVGLGAPKQERWMACHKGCVKGFMVGVGAGFDYFAGNIKRAPMWIQKSNLEWLYRLMQEPRRLFMRYIKTNTKFIWHAYIRGE